MPLANETRQAVREQYRFACGYCGVSEVDAGGALEIDHFCPVGHGGSDDWDNLVYACPACNRNKASYWSSADAPPHTSLLHPLQDDLDAHIALLPDGRLAGLTQRGLFHIEWLHLNRVQLVAFRQRQLVQRQIQERLKEIRQVNQELSERVALQAQELRQLRQQVRRLNPR